MKAGGGGWREGGWRGVDEGLVAGRELGKGGGGRTEGGWMERGWWGWSECVDGGVFGRGVNPPPPSCTHPPPTPSTHST